jgi:multidrug efflux pump subunit AcrB
MPGLTGQIYQQFGVVLSVAVVLSTVVALTLVPPLCVMLLRAEESKPFWPLRKFNAFLDWVTGGYTKAASLLSRQVLLTLRDWSERTSPELKQGAIFAAVAAKLATYKEATSLPFEPSAIPGLGMASGFEFMLQDRLGRSPETLAQGVGQAVFGGMLSATIIGALLTPAFYLLIERMRKRFRPESQTVPGPAD